MDLGANSASSNRSATSTALRVLTLRLVCMTRRGCTWGWVQGMREDVGASKAAVPPAELEEFGTLARGNVPLTLLCSDCTVLGRRFLVANLLIHM